MLHQINGLHHVTSLASSASENNTFFSEVLGLRRIKATVNFDNPEVYHLYYGDEVGNAGSVLTYFPFPNIARGRRGTGEVGTTAFSIPVGSIPFWRERSRQNGMLPTGMLKAVVPTSPVPRRPRAMFGNGKYVRTLPAFPTSSP